MNTFAPQASRPSHNESDRPHPDAVAPPRAEPIEITQRERELGAIIQAYNEVTERLKQSHDQLQRQVGGLRHELADKNRELARRERLAALGEMAAGVAHEIRNPLASIELFASLLRRDLADRPALAAHAGKISRGVQRLDSIVNDILAFAGETDPVCREVVLADVLAEAAEMVAAPLAARHTRLSIDAPPRDVRLGADPDQLQRVVANLLLNAAQAGEGPATVSLTARRSHADSTVEIVVSDRGPGIAPELLDRIFNPFFTTKDSGTGLGLAIVHRIVEAHGGAVTASNRDEGGAMFRVTLPVRAATQSETDPTAENRPGQNRCG